MKPRTLNIRTIKGPESANAFLLGLIFNQNQKAERAWEAPWQLKKRIGTLNPKRLMQLPPRELAWAVSEKPALHPFIEHMTRHVLHACQLLVDEYGGDARRVWSGKTTSEALRELQRFSGIGTHKATVGVFLLKHHLGVAIKEDGGRLNIRTTCPSLFEIYGGDES